MDFDPKTAKADDEGFDPLTAVAFEKPGTFGPSVKRGAGNVISSTGTTLQDVFGENRVTNAIHDYGHKLVEENPAEITDIAGVKESPGTFAKQALAEQVPQFGLTAAGIGGGALLGSAVAPGPGTVVGGILGGLFPTFVQEYGGIREEQKAAGIDEKGRAVLTALPATALEAAFGPEAIVAKNIIKSGGKVAEKELAMLGRNLAPDESRLAHIGKSALRSTGEEAATEVAQTALERVGAKQDLTGPDATNDYVLSGLAGGIAGGVFGGGASTFTPRQAEVAPPVQEEPQQTIAGVLPAPSLTPDIDPQAALDEQRAGADANAAAATLYAERDAEAARRQAAMDALRPAAEPTIAGALPAPSLTPDVSPQAAMDEQRASDKANASAAKVYAERTAEELRRRAFLPDAGPLTKAVGRNIEHTALALPSPDSTVPGGETVVDTQGTARPMTYAEQSQSQQQRSEADSLSGRATGIKAPLTEILNPKDGKPWKTGLAASQAVKKQENPGEWSVVRLDKNQFVIRNNFAKPAIQATQGQPLRPEAQPSPSGEASARPPGAPLTQAGAAKVATEAAQRGVQYDVMPHPTVPGRFMVAPKRAPVTIEGQATRVDESVAPKVEAAAAEAATSPQNALPAPTEAQKEAGNFKMGHVAIQGLDVTLEHPKGSARKEGWQPLNNHYGYIKRTEGADGEQVDTFVGDNPSSSKVFIVDQVKKDGKFDEHKVMLGFNSQAEAEQAYAANYPEGWAGMGGVAEKSVDDFKEWLKGDTSKPAANVLRGTPQIKSEQAGTTQDAISISAKESANVQNAAVAEPSSAGRGGQPAGSERNAPAQQPAGELEQRPGGDAAGTVASVPAPAPVGNAESEQPGALKKRAKVAASTTGQDGISARLKRQNEIEETNRFDGLYQKLMSAKAADLSGLVTGISKEDAKRVIDRLDAAPGDNPAVRKALAAASGAEQPTSSTIAPQTGESNAKTTAETDAGSGGQAGSAAAEINSARPDNQAEPVQSEGGPETVKLVVDSTRDRLKKDSIKSVNDALRSKANGKLKQVEDRVGHCFKYAAAAARDGLGDMVIGRNSGPNHTWHAVIKLDDGTIYDPTMRASFAPGVYEALDFTAVKTLTSEEVKNYIEKNDGIAPDAKNQGLLEKKKPSAESKTAQASATEDAGAELWYNRRNRAGAGIKWDDVQGLNDSLKVKEVTKSKVWPRPDYEAMVTDGMQPLTAHLVKQVYDSIPTKPDVRGTPTDADMQTYIETVQKIRDAVFDWARDINTQKAWAQKMMDAARNSSRLNYGDQISISKLMSEGSGGKSLIDRVFPIPAGERHRFRGPGSEENAKVARVINNKTISALQPGFDEALRATKAITEGWPSPQEAWEKQYAIHQSATGEKAFFITKKKSRSILEDGFKTRDDAVTRARELAKRESKAGFDDNEDIPLSSMQRAGVTRRAPDENITSEKLKETFGFRGVNFGNWMKGDSKAKNAERQAHLNHAYDSFHDLAEVMGVPPNAMSLNGMLGIAFGAQGSGGGAAAHFVPGVNEINLTRFAGAGALAHEWGHALDHYFSVQAGSRFAKASNPFISDLVERAKDSSLRPEITAAFNGIVNAMEKRPLTPKEVADQADIAKNQSIMGVNRWLAHFRKELEANAKAADKETALKAFDELAERIRRGDLGEGHVKIGTGRFSAVPDVIGQVRSLYKDATGRVPLADYVKGLDSNASHLRYLLKEKEATAAHVPQTTSTNYKRTASAIDKDKGGKQSWSTRWEMFARAFESYVMDKLRTVAARNDYLVRAGKAEPSPEYLKAEQELGLKSKPYPYPQGEERKTINAAFDQLIEDIETRQEGDNTVMFSREDTPEAPAFYSELTRQIENFKQPKADAKMWKGIIANLASKGVKKEEIEWSGVNEWLDAQTGVVTKQQLADFLRANEIQVQEVEKGGVLEDMDVAAWWNDEGGANEETPWPDLTEQEQQDATERYRDEVGQEEGSPSTKFSSYQTPGGKNYRELLLTLPVDQNREHAANSERVKQLIAERDALDVPNATPAQRTLWRNLETQINMVMRENKEAGQRTAFRSSHFEEPNILAHMRFNERTDADGKRVLFIEEVQSDWHQKGRRHGYRTKRNVYQVQADIKKLMAGRVGMQQLNDEEKAKLAELNKESGAAGDATRPGVVSDAPFKTTWPMLAMKRMTRYAAENGFDRIAWTTGAQQAERYDLSKRIDQVILHELKGHWQIVAKQNGKEVLRESVTDKEKIADYVGKEIAERLLAKEPEGTGARTLSGVDLKVGGEGMLGFYDKMLPNEVNKYVKKWDTKVGSSDLVRGEPQWNSHGWTLHQNGKQVAGPFGSETEAKAAKTPVHSVDVTPTMRESAMQGQPLFKTDKSFTPEQAMRGAALRFDALSKKLARGDALTPGEAAEYKYLAANRQNAKGLSTIYGFKLTDNAVGLKQAHEDKPFSSAIPSGVMAKTVKQELAKAFGEKGVTNLMKSGILRILSTRQELPADLLKMVNAAKGRTMGLYDPRSKTAYIISDELKPNEAVKTLLHEIGEHYGLETMLGRPAYARLKREIRMLKGAGNPAVNEAWAKVAKNYKFLKENDDRFIREVIAHMGEQPDAVKLPFFKRIIQAIRRFLFKNNLVPMRLTDDDIVGMVVASLRKTMSKPVRDGTRSSVRGPQASRDTGVMFSRSDEPAYSNAASAVRQKVGDYFDTQKTFNSWWHRTVGTQYHKAQVDKDFGRVFDAGQNFLHDVSRIANEAADLAPNLLPRLEGVRDILKGRASAKDVQAIAAPIFQGTLTDEKAYTDAELRDRFKLNPKQVRQYREFRAATNKSLDNLAISEFARIARKKGVDDVVARSKGLSMEDAAKAISDALEAAGKVEDAKLVREKAGKVTGLKVKGYAPLMRFGQHTVYVTKGDQQVYFGMFESQAEANKMARGMRESNPGATVKQGVLSQEASKLFQGVTPDTLELFAESVGADESEIFQTYLRQAVNNRSALKRLIERKGVAGFSEDATRVLANFLTSNARAASGNYHYGEMLDASNAIPKEKGDVKDEAINLMRYLQNPQEEAQALRGFLFVNFLGGSIASAAVNMTQPLMMTFPYLSQFGAGKAAAAMSKAMPVATGVTKPGNPALKAAVDRAVHEGLISPQEIHQLYAEATRSGGRTGLAVRKALTVWGSLFSLAEQFNRKLTFVAAHEMARTMSEEERGGLSAYDFAAKAINETQGVYNRGNRPNWARGALGSTIFTFKQYSVSYLEFLKRLPAKEKALALGILMVSAGISGLPFADDLDDLIDTIAQALGYNFSSKATKRAFITNVLGKELGEFALNGFSALPGMPLDVQARLGVGNLIPGTGLLKRSQQDKGREVLEVLGPAGGLAQNAADAFGRAQAGDLTGVAREFAPVAVQNAMRAMDMVQLGMYRDSKGRKVLDTDGYDAFIKGVGFQPAGVARESRRIGEAYQSIQMANTVEADLSDRIARAVFEGDTQGRADAYADLRDYNAKNPSERIVITPAQIQSRVKAMRQSRQQRFVKQAPKELRGQTIATLQP